MPAPQREIDVTFLFQAGVGRSTVKYTPETRVLSRIESHIYNPGLAEDLAGLQEMLGRKRYPEAILAYRASVAVMRPGNPAQAVLDRALATIAAAAGVAIVYQAGDRQSQHAAPPARRVGPLPIDRAGPGPIRHPRRPGPGQAAAGLRP